MEKLQFVFRKLLAGIPLLLGVTFISFVLMVYFGPDQTWTLLSKNPTEQEIASVRAQLGYDQPFLIRYVDYLREMVTLDFGHSNATGERVTGILERTVPTTLILVLPGFILGNLLGIALAALAALYRGGRVDRLITGGSVVGMSISFVVIIVAFQAIFGVTLGWFPVRGWQAHNLSAYLYYVTVPTLALVFVSLGYNTRFFRAVMVEEFGRDHVRTARAFGAGPVMLMFKHVLKNCLIPFITRIMFSIPAVVISGSLLIEAYFGIPGVGKVTYDAITTGDQPVLKAVVGLTAVLFVFILLITDMLYKAVDPRIELK